MSDHGPRTDRLRNGRHTVGNDYRVARGDELEQDKILHPATVRMCMDGLAAYAGALAYTPAVQQLVEETLTRRFEEDIGSDIFVPPNYGVYEEPEMAAFYGVDTSMISNIQTRKENYAEQQARLVRETVMEVEPELRGLAMQMEQYRLEDWARHGTTDENIYVHQNPDVTLFRNYTGGRAAIDLPIATSEKSNVVELYQGQPEYTFPQPHPGWEVDRLDGVWARLN